MIIQGKIRHDNPEAFTDQEMRGLSGGTRGYGAGRSLSWSVSGNDRILA